MQFSNNLPNDPEELKKLVIHFNKELITKKEFIQKVINSTIACKYLTHFINEW